MAPGVKPEFTVFSFAVRGSLGLGTLRNLQEALDLDVTVGVQGHELAQLAIGDHAYLYVTEVEPGEFWRLEALAVPQGPVDRGAVEAVRQRVVAVLPTLGVDWTEDE